jgi:hypothetical protein
VWDSTTPHPVHTMPGFLMCGTRDPSDVETSMTQPPPKNVVHGSLMAPGQKGAARVGSTILASVARIVDCMPCLVTSNNRVHRLKNACRIQPPLGAFAQQISPDSIAMLVDLQASYLTIRPYQLAWRKIHGLLLMLPWGGGPKIAVCGEAIVNSLDNCDHRATQLHGSHKYLCHDF